MSKWLGIVGISLTLFAVSAYAQTFGQWTVGSNEDRVYAATVNDSGNVFGKYCYPADDTCVWLLGLKVQCKVGDRYSVLANVDSGATTFELYCYKSGPKGGLAEYSFTDFDSVSRIAGSNPRIGIAFPLEGDNFRVIRFDLEGAVQANRAMITLAEKRQKSIKQNTKDKVI